MILTDYDGYSEDYWKNTELNRGIFLNFSSADQLFLTDINLISVVCSGFRTAIYDMSNERVHHLHYLNSHL